MAIQADALGWLSKTENKFDIILADAPFEETPAEGLNRIVFEKKLLKKNGVLIIEHASSKNLSTLPQYAETRKYSNVSFSFFNAEVEE